MARVTRAQPNLAPRRRVLFELMSKRDIRLVVGDKRSEAFDASPLGGRYARINPAREKEPADPYLVFDPPFRAEEHRELEVFQRWVKPETAKEKGYKIIRSRGRNAKGYVFVSYPGRVCSFFSATSKMSAGSWSIPAGGTVMGGTCPSANTMEIVGRLEPETRRKQCSVIPKLAVDLTRATGSHPRALPMAGDRKPLQVLGEASICEKCVTGDALIPVRGRGLVRLDKVVEDVERGACVDVWIQSSQGADTISGGWVRTTQAYRRGVQPVVRVMTTCGMVLRCTANHRIWTDEGWVEAGDLRPDDRLELCVSSVDGWPDRVSLQAVEATASEAARADAEPDFPREWTKQVGLVLGYLLANGSVAYSSTTAAVSLSAHADDASDAREIMTWLSRWGGAGLSESSCVTLPDAERPIAPNGGASGVNFKVNRRVVVRFLDACTLDKRPAPEARRAPPAIFGATKEAVTGFLSGLFSADGSIGVASDGHGHKKTVVSLSSVSIDMLRDVQLLLLSLGIRATICEYKNNRERGYLPLWKLSIDAKSSLEAFRREVGFHNKRKAAILAEADVEYGGPSRSSSPRKPWATVLSVVGEAEPAEVFDIGVEHDAHLFVGNGLTLHNCYAAKGNFGNANTQLWQIARFAWAWSALERGTFVREMSDALERFLGNTTKRRQKKQDPLFFRLHDSGDFFSPEYLAAWADVCANFPRVRFWAPTRVWMLWPKQMVAASERAPNLVLRPSALQFSDPAPMVPGAHAAGSTAHVADAADPLAPERLGIAQWDCPAYALDGHACAGALDPSRAKDADQRAYNRAARAKFRALTERDAPLDCRMCWSHPEVSISYHAH